MLPAKSSQNKSGATVRCVGTAEKRPKSSSIITYSPSKFLVQGSSVSVGSGSYTKKPTTPTHHNTNTHSIQNRQITKSAIVNTNKLSTAKASTTTSSYYVVKAGSLGSAATVSAATAATVPTSPSSSPTSKMQLHAKPSASAVGASATPTTTSPTESSSTISVPGDTFISDKMEHSYLRDSARTDINNSGLAPARTILVRHPPQCPSCHTYPMQEESHEAQQAHVPPYDEIAAKEMMNECAHIAKYVKNNNSEEQDWEARINQIGWTAVQKSLFEKVARILDQDQLARLANEKRQHEAIHRRVTVDKSSSRMRRALASIAWEPRTTQWLHALLMENLPPTYMASYLDIMQTLKTKLPTLTDKMLFSRPLNNSQELLAPVMKKKWDPVIMPKSRHLPHNAIMVVLPSMPTTTQVPERMQRWYKALANITQVVQITLPNSNDRIGRQNLDQVAETIVSLTRVRIHELRTENPNRGIILIGFNAGAALALQVAMSESVACVICMGFAYNTLRGPRGAPDDRLLDIKAPILFIIGQNSARSSQEEMEMLRERMQSESTLVVVGSADDALRVPKSKRRIEGVTQAMVDAMVVDELFDFVNKTLSNPPGPRMPISLMTPAAAYYKQKTVQADGNANKTLGQSRKRKNDGTLEDINTSAKIKHVPHIFPSTVGRPRTRPLPNIVPGGKGGITATGKQAHSNEDLNMSMESILDENLDYEDVTMGDAAKGNVSMSKPIPSNTVGVAPSSASTTTPKNTVPLAAGTKIKMISSNQFVQLKSMPTQNKLINYTINKGSAVTTGNSIGSIVKTLPSSASGQQIFTLKTPIGQTTHFVTAASPAAQQKYTVVKNPNGTTTLQLTKNVPATTAVANAVSSGMDLSNIIDMPIVFADNDGNIAEQQEQQPPVTKSASTNNVGQLIISQKIIKEGNQPTSTGTLTKTAPTSIVSTAKGSTIMLNKGLQQLFSGNTTSGGGNKVVYLNRSSIKPMGGVVTARLPSGATSAGTLQPYTKILLSSPKGSTAVGATGTPPGTLRHTGSVSLGNKSYPQFQVINSVTGTPSISGDGKQQIRNIYFKSATGLKQVPVQMLANRTAGTTVTTASVGGSGGTLRRVVNIGAVTTKAVTGGTQVQTQPESQPKVIKLQATTTTTATVTPTTTTKSTEA
ncbi:uncharacterized protein LOC115634813 isoform X2 [Scaptodrosophila lebanonensis]|uniref:Uncharacterized protein LOC115634813 isoform X2 n=1 Tax=Drosophila lebanonensis TaxID=7225 RepID=A0A6J2UK68_DROLE|nr:uncharacterized protein LOC115634813 isoform X2 [Scaptodrosophila lebanonensis]